MGERDLRVSLDTKGSDGGGSLKEGLEWQ